MRPKFKFILFALLAVCFTAQAESVNEYVTVGTGKAITDDYGFGENSQYFYSQQIIIASEMQNRACTITDIAYKTINFEEATTTGSLEIFLCETELSEFSSSNDRVAVADMTLVYSNNAETLGTTVTGWKVLHLNSEFSYSGSKNLIVGIRSSKSTVAETYYYYTTYTSNRYLKGTSDKYYMTFGAMTPGTIAPNIRISTTYQNCGSNHTFTSNSYSENGFGICDVCNNEIKTKFQPLTVNSTNDGYLVQNAGNLMYLAQTQNAGGFEYYYDYYITNDIDLTGLTWTPIGNSDHIFGGRIHGPANINGLKDTDYLVTEFKGTLDQLRMNNGSFIDKGISGCSIKYCFTEGQYVFRYGQGAQTSSYSKNSCTSSQLTSGEIAYKLNGNGKNYWRQTIGTDNLPVLNDDTKKIVYRYTQCEKNNYLYTNSASKSGTHVEHNFVNTVCDRSGCPNNMPTTISGDVSLNASYTYARTVDATVSGTISFANYYTDQEKNNWQAICLPFSMNYTSANANNYELAKLYRYDGSEIKITKLNVGDVTEANETYVIRPLVNNITFKANNGNLSGLSTEIKVLETDDEIITIVKNYTKNTSVTTNKMYMMDNALKFPTSTVSMAPFRWIANPQSKKEGAWQGATTIGLTPIYLEYAIEDNGSNAYTIASDIEVANFTYTRSITNVNKWQAFYVPFGVTVDANLLDSTDVATFKEAVTLADGKTDAIVVEKLEAGAVINAHTPFLLRIKREIVGPFTFKFNDVTLPGKPASNTVKVLNSDLATYTITGVYDVYKDIYNTWYAVSKSDGQFHKAKVHNDTKLPPYRFYMTIASHNPSSELRFSCVEEEELTTGIANIQTANNSESYYTIDGKRVSSSEDLEPGFYIKNGKKMMIKK